MSRFIRWYIHRSICLSTYHTSSWFSTRPCEGFLSSLHVVTRVDGSHQFTEDLMDQTCYDLFAVRTAPVSIFCQTSNIATLLLFSATCRGLSIEITKTISLGLTTIHQHTTILHSFRSYNIVFYFLQTYN